MTIVELTTARVAIHNIAAQRSYLSTTAITFVVEDDAQFAKSDSDKSSSAKN